MKLVIQSISDIITNSSSEIFCQIDGSNEVLMEIAEYLAQYIHEGLCNEEELGMDLQTDESEDKHIYISCPYGGFPTEFLRAGLSAMLEGKFNNYSIKYDDFSY